MALSEEIDNILSKMTQGQRLLFEHNLRLWEKTVELNGRPQHFDSFDVDINMLKQEWHHFLEDVNSINFSLTLTHTAIGEIPPAPNEDSFGFVYALKKVKVLKRTLSR